jgi:integrase
MTLSESISQWCALAGIGKRPNTQKYHREIAKLILDQWPDPERDVSAIASSDVASFTIKLSEYSAPRFNAAVSILKATVPAAKILKRRRVPVKERANINQTQFERLLTELDGRPRSHGGLIVRFLSHTGLRINEARQLRWSDVQADYILLPGKFSKNGKPRHIPFVNGTQGVLEALRRIATGERILPAHEVRRALATACKLAGVPRLTHHDMRHIFTTRCIESGVDVPTAARWLGHQDGGALPGENGSSSAIALLA